MINKKERNSALERLVADARKFMHDNGTVIYSSHDHDYDMRIMYEPALKDELIIYFSYKPPGEGELHKVLQYDIDKSKSIYYIKGKWEDILRSLIKSRVNYFDPD